MLDSTTLYPRLAEERLTEALAYFPATLIHGPRRCGKTTLACTVGEPRGYGYVSFDDGSDRKFAIEDPVGFVASLPERVILDEVQRVPTLFLDLKMAIDRNPSPGRFILTGSANVLKTPKLGDSLAGRMIPLRLHPLAQCELERRSPGFLDTLFSNGFTFGQFERLGNQISEKIAAGGYPEALRLPAGSQRISWYRALGDILVENDARNFANIRASEELSELMGLVATQTARFPNATKFASATGLSRPTVNNYLTLLENLFLLERLRPWHKTPMRQFIKSPKLHFGDTGLACALLNIDATGLEADRALLGQLLETFVLLELQRQVGRHDVPTRFFHYRDSRNNEVDIVIEHASRVVAGIEVKASSTVTPKDFRGLRQLRDDLGENFACGVVLYDGKTCLRFSDRLHAVPIRALWETPFPQEAP